jgi:hypothetical protein
MLLDFFTNLRKASVPVTVREYLTLMEGLSQGLAQDSVETFYGLAGRVSSRTSAISMPSAGSLARASKGWKRPAWRSTPKISQRTGYAA